MGMELLMTDVTSGEVIDETVAVNTFLTEVDNTVKMDQDHKHDEPIKLGLVDGSSGINGEITGADHIASANFPKDAVDEWPAPKQIHTFYLVKYRFYDDPKLKAKFEQADKDMQKKTQARFQITEALKAKRSERSHVISQLKPLTAENQNFKSIVDKKIKEIEPLTAALGKLRNSNNDAREKGIGLCSSEEELNDLIRSLHYRIQHESNTLSEEKKLLKEINQLEGTREKVIAHAAMRAKIQDSLGQKEAIQGQVKLIGGDLDDVRKEKQAVATKIRHLEEKLKAIDDGISSLQDELTAATEKKDKAYETVIELRKARDEANTCYFQNRSLLNTASELAAKKDISALEGLSHSEVEKFMSQWISSRAFRDDYEKRILISLDNRQLSRDGRIRNPDEKPIMSRVPVATESEIAPAKVIVKQAKGHSNLPAQHDTVPINKTQKEDIAKSTKTEMRGKVGVSVDSEDDFVVEKSVKNSSKPKEIDAAKLKEMKREEEIAKAKFALERKKKLAEKAAAKAAVRAQKEGEKKLKEKEKKAMKKTGASLPPSAEEAETDAKVDEPEEADLSTEAPAASGKRKEPKEKVIRHRSRAKAYAREQIPKMILKRKKSHIYWIWAAAPVVLIIVLLVFVYYFSFGKN